MTIEAQAPGKLVIVGEYAVLAGSPALAVAVDVRAHARIELLPGQGNQLVIADGGESFRFRWGDQGGPRWEGASPGAFGLPLEACAQILTSRGLLPRFAELPACRIVLETAAFHETDAAGHRVKLGLGSSAAVVVALTGALLRFAGGPAVPRQELIAICCEAHRRLQGGVGSGIDVVTSLTGGVVGMDFADGTTVPRVNPLPWPRQLQMLAVWSGTSASTPAMLGRLRTFGERQALAFGGHMQRLGAIASRAAVAWRMDDVGGILEAVSRYESALRQLDEAARIGIFTPVHDRMRAIALGRDAVYKPSGAGGGDFGIALTDSRHVESALRADYEAAGYRCLEGKLCAPGLNVRINNAPLAAPTRA